MSDEEKAEKDAIWKEIDDWNFREKMFSAEKATIEAKKKMFWVKVEKRFNILNIMLRIVDGKIYKRSKDKKDPYFEPWTC